MKSKRITQALLVFFLLAIKTIAQPTITSFSPSSGVVGSTVTITGTGFNNSNPSNNIVYFGATKATVLSCSTSTSLSVNVPIGSYFGPITILNASSGLMAFSSDYFTPVASSLSNCSVNNQAGVFYANTDFTTGANSGPYDHASGDINKDGLPDIVTVNYNSCNISVMKNTSISGTISFASRQDFSTGAGSYPNFVTLGDLDGDGDLDIVVSSTSNKLHIFQNISSGGAVSFAARQDIDLTAIGKTSPLGLAIGDLDNDGRPEIALADWHYTSTTPTITYDNLISIFYNTSSGGSISFSSTTTDYNLPISSPTTFNRNTHGYDVKIADLNGDSYSDILVANDHSINSTLVVLKNTGSGFASPQSYATPGQYCHSLAIGDLDGDNKLDVALTNEGDDKISILLNTSSGGSINFAGYQDFSLGTYYGPVDIKLGDLNGDGMIDIAVALNNRGTMSFYNNVSVLFNTTSGGFLNLSSSTNLSATNGAYTKSSSTFIDDFDGDGLADISATTSNQISTWRNQSAQVNLHLKAILQSYWNGSQMNPAPFNGGLLSDPNVADWIKVELHNNSAPYGLAYTSCDSLLSIYGYADLGFPSAVIGNSYYIVFKQRNHIDTWSSNPVTFTAYTNYDFTTSATQAYGSNLAYDGASNYLILNGDINRDGSVDQNDYPIIDIDASNGLLGYYFPPYATDLNGDNVVDFNDYPDLDDNSSIGVFVNRPY